MSQSPFKKFYYSAWFVIICLGLIFFFSWSTISDYYAQRDLREDIQNLEKDIQHLNQQRTELQDTLNYVQSEDFVEIEARTKLNLRKPGEKIIIVSDKQQVEELSKQSDEAKRLLQEEESNYQAWWNYFFGY